MILQGLLKAVEIADREIGWMTYWTGRVSPCADSYIRLLIVKNGGSYVR